MKKEQLSENLEKLKNAKNIQCTKGNYDYDEYMRGMANGLILAEAIMENKEPNYFDAPEKPARTKQSHNKVVAGLLAIFLGGLGLHKFYLGQNKAGVIYLLFFWTYVPALLGLFEGISLLMYTEENFNKKFNA